MKISNSNYKVLFIILLFSLLSCEEKPSGFVLSTKIDLSVLNHNETDLLNPENSESYLENSIQLFNLKNGNKEKVFDPHLDYPKNFFIYKDKKLNRYIIRIFLNHTLEESKKYPVTYVQWKEGDLDTLKSKYSREEGFIKNTKVWLNDELIWSTDDNNLPQDKYPVIVKNN